MVWLGRNDATSCGLGSSLFLISGPSAAWIYFVSVWVTYAVNCECTWSSKLPNLVWRTSWLVASVATTLGLCPPSETSNSDLWSIIPTGLAFWGGSLLLSYWTRVHDVVGMVTTPTNPIPPHYGKQHLKGKTILITGANSGIGKETTLQLASMGATIYLLCRSAKRANEAVQDICRQLPADYDTSLLKVVPMDLGSFDSIRQAVKVLVQEHKLQQVDVLINNAGLMMGHYTSSTDGHELMMQANHLGHFLLTRLLQQEKLLSQEDCRIVNLTSSTYQMSRQGFDFDDMMCNNQQLLSQTNKSKGSYQRPYTLFGQYSMTKLANILFTKEWIRRFPQDGKNPLVFAVHPGIVRTNVTSNMNWYWRVPNDMFAWFVAAMQKSPEQGAYSSVFCAAAPRDRLPRNGSYVMNCHAEATNPFANSVEDAKRLWEVSERLVGME